MRLLGMGEAERYRYSSEATFSANLCLISVRSTDRVSGGGATFIPLYHPGALLPLFDVVDPLVENLRFKI